MASEKTGRGSTIQERLRRSNFIMLVVPVAIAGVQRVQEGDLDTPIAYEEPDEFRPACDAVDEMAARLKESLAQQQKKQELIAELSHGLKTPLTPDFCKRCGALAIGYTQFIAIQLFNATATTLNCISQICCLNVALIS